MLAAQDIRAYKDLGYLVVDDVVTQNDLQTLHDELAQVVAKAAAVTTNTTTYDLEPGHSAKNPQVRRIKEPHKIMPGVKALIRNPTLVSILTQLIGPGVRFQTSKLNMKSAGVGASVEWHQDWAFYPHTNEDLLAVGIMLDDIDESNGPMQVIPGSHTGPIYDHHANGYFCGAIDPTRNNINFDAAVPLTGKAGSMTFHHARAIHGSAPNHSDRSRNFLLFQFTAVDAWPLIEQIKSMDAYDEWIVAGKPTLMPRLEAVPVRLPLPPAMSQGSIYENQRALENRYFNSTD